MKEISYCTGFRHQSEFTAWFKKYTGLPPSEFRSQAAAVNEADAF
jgi:AraC-like DNA-binding protein